MLYTIRVVQRIYQHRQRKEETKGFSNDDTQEDDGIINHTHKEVALSHLCIGAIFFAMRSCDYLKCSRKEESKRTQVVRLKNIR